MYSQNHNLTENNPYIGENASSVKNIELAFSTNIKQFTGGVNVGYRHRAEADDLYDGVAVSPLGSQFISSFALAYYFPTIDTRVLTETYSSVALTDGSNIGDRKPNSVETLFGFKHMANDNWAIHGGYAHGWNKFIQSKTQSLPWY